MQPTAALVLFSLLLITACGKPEPTPGGAAPQLAPAALAPAIGKALLTEAKLGQYMVYQREMAPHMKELLEQGMTAIGKSGGEAAKEPGLQKVPDYEAAALQKSGLARAEVFELARIVARTVAPRSMGSEESKQLARDAFEKQYGKEAAAALLKAEPELVDNQIRLFKAMTQK